MELRQVDVVGGIVLADGTELKALTGADDYSRFCVVAYEGAHGNQFRPLPTREHENTRTPS